MENYNEYQSMKSYLVIGVFITLMAFDALAVGRALRTAATGLKAQQANIDRLANDMANVNTDGYKRHRVEFSDLYYETVQEAGAQIGATTQTPVGIQYGMGVKIHGNHKIFEQGPSRMTYRPYDLMIEGSGFFPIQLQTGEVAYTRNGSFRLSAEGVLVTVAGHQLLPQVTVPSNAVNFKVTPSGEIIVDLPGGEEATLGNITLIKFINREGLTAAGTNVYFPSAASGQAVQGVPGENGYGLIQQGALEGSNVNVANSMVEMITTQRAYELNTKMMMAADKMLDATVNIR
ncbi:MAG: flagellar basal-body rod protein FlgG [Bdellovibrionaceae bacterium]|nr:flagellar basal-body rod protein FlgG [Pseudobdellovibrionaceae bacterium]